MTINRRAFMGFLSATPLLASALPAWASGGYPSQPIRIFVPFDPGSGSDVYARHFGALLSEVVGQPVPVENRPGAGGSIAVQGLLRGDADGYTVLLGSNSPMAVNVSTFLELPYDPLTELEPICGLTRSMAMIAVPPDSPLDSIEDLVAQGRSGEGLNMGTYSPGYQLSVASFLQQADFRWDDIAYRGLGQTVADLMGSQLDVGVIDSAGGIEQARSGQIKILAVTGESRHPGLPDVPTLVELGYPDAVHYSWTALWVKAGTAPEIVELLSSHLLEILARPASEEFIARTGAEPMPFGPERMREFQRHEIARFGEAVEILDFEKV